MTDSTYWAARADHKAAMRAQSIALFRTTGNVAHLDMAREELEDELEFRTLQNQHADKEMKQCA